MNQEEFEIGVVQAVLGGMMANPHMSNRVFTPQEMEAMARVAWDIAGAAGAQYRQMKEAGEWKIKASVPSVPPVKQFNFMLKKLFSIFHPPSSSQSGWSRPYDIAALYRRLGSLPPNDELYPLLLGFLDAQIVAQAGAKVTADATAQLAGRLAMCDDLKKELYEAWARSHPVAK